MTIPASLEPPFERGGDSPPPQSAVGPWPALIGLGLLHPNLLGQMGPTLSRLLARSTLGRSILRPLLRSEVGEVANRGAWHHAERLTPEVLELYKAPLRVEGWDVALMETARLGKEHTQGDLAAHLAAARQLPTLVVTATDDYIATPAKVGGSKEEEKKLEEEDEAFLFLLRVWLFGYNHPPHRNIGLTLPLLLIAQVERMCATSLPEAQTAVLSDCGHLSHEEAPGLLLQELMPFCGQVLLPHQH